MNNEVDPMEIMLIDGIPKAVSDLIIKTIHSQFEAEPENPLDTERVMQATNALADQVKNCCYALLTCRLIKASYFPVHQDCGARIGQTEQSAYQLQEKIQRGYMSGKCQHCGKNIVPNRIVVAMDFWKLGATVK